MTTSEPKTKRRAARRNNGRRPRSQRRERPWPVTANALLLLLEAAAFLGGSALYLGPLGELWPLTPAVWSTHSHLVDGLLFAVLAMIAMAASIGFLRVAPGAWLMAVLVQGADLFIALLLYFSQRPWYVYLMMLTGIIMVLYLHQADVTTAFRVKAKMAGVLPAAQPPQGNEP